MDWKKELNKYQDQKGKFDFTVVEGRVIIFWIEDNEIKVKKEFEPVNDNCINGVKGTLEIVNQVMEGFNK